MQSLRFGTGKGLELDKLKSVTPKANSYSHYKYVIRGRLLLRKLSYRSILYVVHYRILLDRFTKLHPSRGVTLRGRCGTPFSDTGWSVVDMDERITASSSISNLNLDKSSAKTTWASRMLFGGLLSVSLSLSPLNRIMNDSRETPSTRHKCA